MIARKALLLLVALTLTVPLAQTLVAQNRARSRTAPATAAPVVKKTITTPAPQTAAVATNSATSAPARSQEFLSPLEREILDEMNLARTEPQKYADYVAEWKQYYTGKRLVRPGHKPVNTFDGVAALDEAVNFLRVATPLPAFQSVKGLCLAAHDHALDLSTKGITGHAGSDGSLPDARVERYGRWDTSIGETIVYDMDTARAVVIELLIDDGNPTRGHRANIFNPSYKLAGLSVGEASTFGSRCVIDYVGGFREGSADDSQPGAHRRTRNSPRD